MTLGWAKSVAEQLWHSPAFPMWVALAAAILFAIFILVILLRADKSVANIALALIALVAIAVAAGALFKNPFSQRRMAAAERTAAGPALSLAALACLDGLAGDAVEAACERPLFSSAESSAAAVSYAAAQISRLAAAGPQAVGEKAPPEVAVLRRALERDRYGLVAHVLAVREGCTPADCAFYAVLSDHKQITSNMSERVYEGLIGRYALNWNAAPVATAAAPAAVMPPPMSPGAPGRPLSGDFPNSSSIPPVSIMTGEPPPGAGAAAKPPAAPAQAQAAPRPSAPKKPPAPKRPPSPPPAPAPEPQQSDDNN